MPGMFLFIIGLVTVFENTQIAILTMAWGMMLTPIFWLILEYYLKKRFNFFYKIGIFLLAIFILAFGASDPEETETLIQAESNLVTKYIAFDLETNENLVINADVASNTTGNDLALKNTDVTAMDIDWAVTDSLAKEFFSVVSVTDGDTLKINIDGQVETIRVIGINTPETVHPNKPVECFGREASAKAKSLLSASRVTIFYDQSQGERDKYGRLLVYVTLEDGQDFGETMIKEGFAYESTYNVPYEKQSLYKAAQKHAETNEVGLWAAGACSEVEIQPELTNTASNNIPNPSCNIKGNISVSSGEKIYHVPGQQNYTDTIINEDRGERWFCSETEALITGWRRALR